MKLYWKKQILNPYAATVVVAFPIIVFLYMCFDAGILPNIGMQLYPGESAAGDDLWIVSHVRHLESFVDAMEWYVMYVKHLFPMFASLAVLPFISMRDGFLPFARTRMDNAGQVECRWIAGSVLRAGATVYAGYLATMLLFRLFFIYTLHDGMSFDVFVENWGLPLSAETHPYLYVLVLGVLRCFLWPSLMALLTVAVSYLTDKIYIYLLVPTVVQIVTIGLCARSLNVDKWPLPLFSPENITWPISREYWGFAHTLHGAWGVLGASLVVIIPSVLMIWYGMRRRRT